MDLTFVKKHRNKFLLAPVYFVLGLVALYHFVFWRRIIPGVYVGDVYVGGMNYDQAKSSLEKKYESTNKTLTLVYGDKVYNFPAESFALQYQFDRTVSRAYEIGRTGNIFADLKDKVAGVVKPLIIPNIYIFDENALESSLAYVTSEVNVEAEDAEFFLDENNELQLISSEIGKKVDEQELDYAVRIRIETMDFSNKLLIVEDVQPKVSLEDLKQHEADVMAAVENPVFIKHARNSWVIDPPELIEFIKITKNDQGQVELTMNEPKVEAYADLLAQEVNILPRGHVDEDEEGKVTNFSVTAEGSELDYVSFNPLFKKALFSNEPILELPMTSVSAPEDLQKYGIVELLGEGTSEYTGSAASRVSNLTLAAERTNGVLVPPGEVYSFNNSVGEISAATGYATAYVISGGRTVLGDGGGVCQTSTTLFRAVLDSGLPVVKRNPHAYRVRYYELDRPVGFDAAIYQPYLDFQFKNDTENYILVQSSADVPNSSLTFKLYGKSDGRTVEISEPAITNETPPPDPLYQDEPSLDKGVVKQVDFSAWGATSTFTRKVEKDGEVLYDDTFTTRYQPWRAIYLVGTKTN